MSTRSMLTAAAGTVPVSFPPAAPHWAGIPPAMIPWRFKPASAGMSLGPWATAGPPMEILGQFWATAVINAQNDIGSYVMRNLKFLVKMQHFDSIEYVRK